jgi:CheY-like chemotaxis protein
VITAIEGVEGLAVARRSRPDLILCDIQIPGKDGYEVARELRADPDLRSTVLAAVTAFAMTGDRERALEAGFDAYITKPIEPELFVGQIRDVIAAGRQDGSRP